MSCASISLSAITLDQTLDYIPFVSAATNIAILVAKVALTIIENLSPSCFGEICTNPFANYIVNEKDCCLCILLAIPFLNILVAYALDLARDPSPGEPYQQRPPVDDITVEIMQSVERSSQETIARSQAIQREHNETIARMRADTIQQCETAIANCAREINSCSEDDAGQKKRARLELAKQSHQRTLDSYLAATQKAS